MAAALWAEKINRCSEKVVTERILGGSFLLVPTALLVTIAFSTLFDPTSAYQWLSIIILLVFYSLGYGCILGLLMLSTNNSRSSATQCLYGLGFGALCHMTLFELTDIWGQTLLGATVLMFLGGRLSVYISKRLTLFLAAALCLHIGLESQDLDIARNWSLSDSRVILGANSNLSVNKQSSGGPLLRVTKDRFYELAFQSTLAASDTLTDLQALPFLLTHIGDVLLLGLSGTDNLAQVIAATPRSIHLVEPDRDLLKLTSEMNLQGKLDPLKQIRIYNESFRRHLSKSRRFFDIIYLSRAASAKAVFSGAQAFQFDEFRTVEGWSLALKRLRAGGILVVPGWYFPNDQRHLTKLVVLAYKTLISSGVTQPRQHLVVVRQESPKHSGAQLLLLISKDPLSAEQLFSLESLTAELELDVLLSPLSEASLDLVWLTSPQTHASALSQLRYNATPPSDLNPFPHLYSRVGQLFGDFSFKRLRENPFCNLTLSTLLMMAFMVTLGVKLRENPSFKKISLASNIGKLLKTSASGCVLSGIIAMLLPLCPQEILSTTTTVGLILISIGLGFHLRASESQNRAPLVFRQLLTISMIYGVACVLLALLRYTQGFSYITIFLLMVSGLAPIGAAIGTLLVATDAAKGDLEDNAKVAWLVLNGLSITTGLLCAFLLILSLGSWNCFCLGLTLLVGESFLLGSRRPLHQII